MDITPILQKAKFVEGCSNSGEIVDVSTIDFETRTFTWMFRGCLRNIESFDDVEFTPPIKE